MKGDRGLSTRFKPAADRGRLDPRKLTARIYTPERDEVVAMAQELGISDTAATRLLLEYAIAQVRANGVQILRIVLTKEESSMSISSQPVYYAGKAVFPAPNKSYTHMIWDHEASGWFYCLPSAECCDLFGPKQIVSSEVLEALQGEPEKYGQPAGNPSVVAYPL